MLINTGFVTVQGKISKERNKLVMFGKKKEKVYSIKYVVLENCLVNIPNDFPIEVIVDESNSCLTFVKGKKDATASLQLNKIVRIESATKFAVQPGCVPKGKPQVLQTLKIVYLSNDEEKEINLCETNYNGTNAINLLKTLLNKHLQSDSPKHVNL